MAEVGFRFDTYCSLLAGRSPKDKRVVREPESEADIWWGHGSPNHPMDERAFILNRSRAVDYLNFLPSMFVFDGFASAWLGHSGSNALLLCPTLPTCLTNCFALLLFARSLPKLTLLPCSLLHLPADWDEKARTKIRVISARPYHALFMHNM